MALIARSFRRISLLDIVSRKRFAADAKEKPAATSVVPQDKKEKKPLAKDSIPRDSKGFPTVLMGIMKPDDPLVQQGYGIGKTAIRLDWWNNNQRWHYWGSWNMLNDINRRKNVVKHAAYRSRMHALMDNNILPVAFRESVEEELSKLPRNCKWESTKSFCQITGRRRGKVLRYRVSRIVFRDMADHGKLAGVLRSHW